MAESVTEPIQEAVVTDEELDPTWNPTETNFTIERRDISSMPFTDIAPLSTPTTPTTPTVKKGLRCYPTIQMMQMMREYQNLKPGVSTQEEIEQFRNTFIVATNLKHRTSLIVVYSVFLDHNLNTKHSLTIEQKIAELEGLDKELDEDIKAIAQFWCILFDRYNTNKPLIIALTQDRLESEPLDLNEKPETARYITVNECNTCKKKKSVTQPLLECVRCRQAAYCSAECQKEDWKAFHKYFCASLSNGC